ncbi:MAG: hypothetical protein K6U04_11440 [Armatimonadetes bacterium]|nr:hypothetical protein [Armatimonadota bacterium]
MVGYRPLIYAVISFFVFSLLYFNFYYRPFSQKYLVVASRVDHYRAALVAARNISAEAQRMATDYPELGNLVEKVNRRLPSEKEVAPLIEEIGRILSKNGLTQVRLAQETVSLSQSRADAAARLGRVNPGAGPAAARGQGAGTAPSRQPPAQEKKYEETMFLVEFVGTYRNITNAVAEMSSASRFVALRGLDIGDAGAEKPAGDKGLVLQGFAGDQLPGKMYLSVYTLKEEREEKK